MVFNFNDLSKQAKIGYNALYNVILSHSVNGVNRFTVPLCLDANNKVSLTERNFIFFDSILEELKLHGYYTIKNNCGRAVEDTKTDFFTVEVIVSKDKIDIPKDIKTFDFSDVDTTKLLKRDGKAEKQKTVENAKALEEKTAEAEETSRKLEEKTAEIKKLQKEVAKKYEQLNQKAIAEFNDDALFSIADCIEVLVKKHCPVPAEFDFSAFENDLFQVISAHWDLKILDK